MNFKPVILSSLKGYNQSKLIKDILAGIIVGIIAIPLSIALAIASGASPREGLITAAIGGFIISLFGGSKVQISGPTGTFSVVVYDVISNYGIQGLMVTTVFAGIILMLMGFFKLGALVKFIPKPIVSGFTSGIAVIIFSGQIKDFLGLRIDSLPTNFIDKMTVYAKNIGTFNPYNIIVVIVSLMIIIYLTKTGKSMLGYLAAILATTAIVHLFNFPISTIGSNYPNLSGNISMPTFPKMQLSTYIELLRPSFTLAVIGAITALLSAVVGDKLADTKHDSDTELIAQGLGNIAVGLLGGIPITGAVARTSVNIKNGGTTPIAGMVHSLFVLVVFLVVLPYAKLIPMATLSAILAVVCYNMFDWEEFKNIRYSLKSDYALLIVSFVLTILFNLITAIEFGLGLAAILFIKRISSETTIQKHDMDERLDNNKHIYEFTGPLFFGNAECIDRIKYKIGESTDAVILDMDKVNSIDATAIASFIALLDKCNKYNVEIYMTNLRKQPLSAINKAKLENHYEKLTICQSMEKVINKMELISI